MGALKIGSVPLRREVIIFAVLFLVGLACGLYFGRALAGEPRSAPTDYAILVARLYEIDQSKTQAISRLQAGGVTKPAEAIATIAASYPTNSPAEVRDAASLRNLALALGAPAATSSASSALPTAWIVPTLVGLVAIALLALLAFKVLGLQIPKLPKAASLGRAAQAVTRPRAFATTTTPQATRPASDASPLGDPARTIEPTPDPDEVERPSGDAPSRAVPPPVRWIPSQIRTRTMQPNDATATNGTAKSATTNGNGTKVGNGGDIPPGLREVLTPPIRPSPIPPTTIPPATNLPTTIPSTSIQPRPMRFEPTKGYSFRSSYRLGDEPYDEIHPISDVTGRALVGACGVSAARFLTEQGQRRYWAFTAWLHDYAGDGQFRAVGLVSRWARDHFADEIDDWRNQGEIDEVRLVDFDTRFEIATSLLAAKLSIEDIDYVQGVPPEAIFNRLAAQFDVQVSRASETGSAAEQAE